MQDSSLLSQFLLGCAPLIDAHYDTYGSRLTIFPIRGDGAMDPAELLRELSTAFPLTEDGRRRINLIISVPSAALLDQVLDLRPPPRFGLEVPSFMAEDAAMAQRLRGLRGEGVSLVAKGRSVSAMSPDMLSCFRLVLTEPSDEYFGVQRPSRLGPRPLDTLIDGAARPEDMSRAFASGIKGVVGWPRHAVEPGTKSVVPPDLRGVIELMNLVERQETIERMERVLKADPTLAFRLLKFINSAAFGLRVEVSSFKHALMLLGFVRLKRWLALLLVSATRDQASRPLIRMAVLRGFLMEELAKALGQEELRGEMFICGVFSLLDQLMRQPFADLLEHVPMPARVQVTLLSGSGPYTDHLALLDAIEAASLTDLRDVAMRMRLMPEALNKALLGALASTRELDV